MARNELFVTVPSLFRCPISLDVMKSPVSLCTGVTYDRSSIQHWLESGHDTCPATMQILSTKDITPNLTLHRLINLWSRQLTLSEQEIKDLIEKIGSECESEKSCVGCLAKIFEFVRGSEENRRFLSSYGGFLEAIVSVLNRKQGEIVALESVFKVLSLILNENGVKEKINHLIFLGNSNCLASILEVLEKGSLDSRIESIKILNAILLDNESKRRVVETESIFSALFDQLRTSNGDNLNDAVLSILITLSGTRSVKTQLVQFGLVQILSKILSDTSSRIPTIEKAIKLLSITIKCSEGRLAVSEDSRCAAGIVEKIIKVGKTAREEAVAVLWSMCYVYKDGRVTEAVVKSNGVTKVLLVMQSEIEGMVRKMCGDLVKVLGKKNCSSGLESYDTKTTHITPY
ncbi:U-box domain-containing protein 29-like [Mangifera indica]|uniref:U-box domain-containing protein 29-like n=1 Tax=Mangifera indica TaxID=29780 RepID=UPI001CF991E1|nr:U-box domain-containing protein 29-like [Mangifera indica]